MFLSVLCVCLLLYIYFFFLWIVGTGAIAFKHGNVLKNGIFGVAGFKNLS